MKRFLFAMGATALMILPLAAQAGQQPTLPTDDCDSEGCTSCEYTSENEVVCEDFSWLEIILIFQGDQVPGADDFQSIWVPPEPPVIPGQVMTRYTGQTLPAPRPGVPTRTANPNR